MANANSEAIRSHLPTFRSGDTSHQRWIINNQDSFFNEGKGQTHMISYIRIWSFLSSIRI